MENVKISDYEITAKAAFAEHSFFNDHNFRRLNLCFTNETQLPANTSLRSRIFMQFAAGDDVPPESALYLSGGNQMEMMESRFARSRGLIPGDISEMDIVTNHFHFGGGLNMRGYSGYTATDDRSGEYHAVSVGTGGFAINLEYDFLDAIAPPAKGRIARYLELDSYLFTDLGMLRYETPSGERQMAKLRMDAGLGFALTVKRFWILDDARPFTLRLDLPLLLNRPPDAEGGYLDFRWMLGIGRSF